MTTRHLFAASITALALAVAPSSYASPLSITTPFHAFIPKVKMVQISFRNDSGAPLELKVGDSVMKVDAGKTIGLHLASGTRVVANTATTKLDAGTLITEVAPYLNGATLSIK